MVAVIDFGTGNLRAIANKVHRLGYDVSICSSGREILSASHLIFPGIGHFGKVMTTLHRLGILDVLRHKALNEMIPVLGICLGMQLFTEGSEEGSECGLGWIPGRTVRFDRGRMAQPLRIPHIGWNTLRCVDDRLPFWRGLEADDTFYFTHSFHVQCPRDVVQAATEYGYDFPSGIMQRNLVGTQFHPEKSQQAGMRLLRNFLRLEQTSTDASEIEVRSEPCSDPA